MNSESATRRLISHQLREGLTTSLSHTETNSLSRSFKEVAVTRMRPVAIWRLMILQSLAGCPADPQAARGAQPGQQKSDLRHLSYRLPAAHRGAPRNSVPPSLRRDPPDCHPSVRPEQGGPGQEPGEPREHVAAEHPAAGAQHQRHLSHGPFCSSLPAQRGECSRDSSDRL